MKRSIIYCAFGLAFMGSLHAQVFTGIITLETENFEIGEKSTIICYLKSPYCKMEISSTSKEGNGSYTLYFNDQKSDMIMISGGTRTVVAIAGLPANKYLENILVAISTGKSQTVAGYSAGEINLKSTNAIIQCFVASELDITFPSVLNSKGILKALKENSIKGTPLEILVKDLSGKPVFSQKIISVNPQTLNEDIFISE